MLFFSITNKGTRRQFTFIVLFFIFCCTYSSGYSAENAMDTMLQVTTSYFKPLQGNLVSVDGKQAIISIGAKNSVKPNMRFQILREEAPFRHPVTKEPIGKLEALVGKLQVKEVREDVSTAEILEGDVREGDTVRISELKIKLLFCQSRDTDWQLSEYYYRKLKDSGRFQLIDTALEPSKPEEVIEEAKRMHADVALYLSTKKTDSETFLVQELYWATDGLKIGSMEIKIDQALTGELSFGEKFFPLEKHPALTQFDVPTSSKLLIMCDVDGDRKQELIFSTGTDLIIYALDRDLHQTLGGTIIKGSTQDHHIWIDSVDLNGNGKDEIIITSMKGSPIISDYESSIMKGADIVSSIYEYDGKEFTLLYQDNVFMRKIGNKLYAQSYSRNLGFDGEVFELRWEGAVKKGDALKLPVSVNIYDFAFFENPMSGRLLLAYDEKGYLTLYDQNSLRLWRSKTSTGGFLTTFRKKAPSPTVDGSEWSVKDRLFPRQNDILYAKRIPFLDIVKGFGYKKSQIRSLQWDGHAMEEQIVIDGVDGTILDYVVTNDNIYILASPVFGIKAANILKGDNPVRKELLIYPLKGM
jgi:hypothetical protein